MILLDDLIWRGGKTAIFAILQIFPLLLRSAVAFGTHPLTTCVSLPKNAVIEALDRLVNFRHLEAFCGEQTVIFVGLNCYEITAELFCGDGRSSAADEWVEDQIARVCACQYYFCQQFFGLLRRVIGVFGHGPKRYANVGPDI